MDVSFLSRPKVKPGEAFPMNILEEKKMPDDVSANVDRLHRYSKAMDIPFWECLNTALSVFMVLFSFASFFCGIKGVFQAIRG